MTPDELLDAITRQYLKDNEEFNGFAVVSLGLRVQEVRTLLRQLITDQLASIHLGPHPNLYIKALPAYPPEVQIAALGELGDLSGVVAYPERRHLNRVVERHDFAGRRTRSAWRLVMRSWIQFSSISASSSDIATIRATTTARTTYLDASV
ncbi:MAG: hypothetical protein JOZ73_05030 [Solirubrobacterales bacterium]|nr:hypothetical protein [Solirubrobacterales bacterium]